jgi:two-component system chemotaxis response regulator CheB
MPPEMEPSRKLKVLIVDDSAFMRTLLRKIIGLNSGFTIVGEAENGRDAIRMARELQPHVITMDVEMPGLDGMEATKAIVAEHMGRLPVVLVSSQGGENSMVEALQCGAVDYIPKGSLNLNLDIGKLEAELCGKLRYWAEKGFEKTRPRAAQRVVVQEDPALVVRRRGAIDLIVIGVSTGGPATLTRLLRAMGRVPVPVVIAQHMPAQFTRSLADNLAHDLGLKVVEANVGEEVAPGTVALLPGGRDCGLRRSNWTEGAFTVRIAVSNANVHPNVDELFLTALDCARNPVAVVLTGMGSDGAKGAKAFCDKGLAVLVQEPQCAIVAGMPEAAIEIGGATAVLEVEEIGARLARWVNESLKSGEAMP